MHATLSCLPAGLLALVFSVSVPRLAAVTVTPSSVTVKEAATQQFTASRAATWTTNCGSISTAGLFHAPLYPKTCTITAIATDGSGSVAATASVVSPITMTPVSAKTVQGRTQQFTSSAPVKWSARCGTISSSGLYTASAPAGSNCTIEGIAASGPLYTVYGFDTILASSTFSIAPINPALAVGAKQQFTASSSATWKASCGTISSTGLYTAPSTPQSCTITATDGSGRTASTSATISVSGSLSITPATAQLHAIQTQQFAASMAVNWSASCGSINALSGFFTAPATASSCVVSATATGGNAYRADAAITVEVVNYLTWKGDNSGLGAQTQENSMTPANVNLAQFGIKWTASLDGAVFAQPLYLNALAINGVPHNVVFAATTNDSLYAFDGDSGALLWLRSFLSTGVTAVSGTMVGSPMPQIGILGTPVIDPETGTLYVVVETAEQNATYFPHQLHAIDVTTGAEKFNGPALVTDARLPPLHKLQRPGLALANGLVYVSMGSISDRDPYHGFLFAFDKQTLAKKYSWNSTPTGAEGGIWMSGAAPAVDDLGNLYVTTGNGTFDGIQNFGEAAIKLSPTLQVLDHFAPFDHVSLSAADSDLGSGSIVILPAQQGSITRELILCGKPPFIYVLDQNKMGHAGSGTDNIVQRLPFGTGATDNCFAAPAFLEGNLYIAGGHDTLKTYSLTASTGLLSGAAVSHGSFAYGELGAQPVVSSDGSSNGIVWTLDAATGQLLANDASNVATQLYSATLPGGVQHFAVPTVINGHVYVGGGRALLAYALQ